MTKKVAVPSRVQIATDTYYAVKCNVTVAVPSRVQIATIDSFMNELSRRVAVPSRVQIATITPIKTVRASGGCRPLAGADCN